MKLYIRITFIALFLLSLNSAWSQIPTWNGNGTKGSLSLQLTTSKTNERGYAPRHVVTIWISTENGVVLKTIVYYAKNYGNKLGEWVSLGQSPDVVSGASLNSFRTFNLTWDGKDKNGNLVDDGTYTIHMELNDCNTVSKSSRNSVNFTKGTSAQTLNPANVLSFSAMEFIWTPEVQATVVPEVSIAANRTEVCAGNTVTFTATPTHGGTASYQWKKNSANTGSNSATYTYTPTSDNDQITCVMTSSLSEASPKTATSNSISITVNQTVTPQLSIETPNTAICSGTNVTFTALATDAGTPIYQWRKNGNKIGTNSETLETSNITDQDVFTCEILGNAACASMNTATSNELTMSVGTSIIPSVSIATTDSSICQGTTAIFTASSENGGAPSFQWKKNGVDVGTDSDTYSDDAITDNDAITCILTSTAECAVPLTVESDPIAMSIAPVAEPTITISTTETTLCKGALAQYSATVENEGVAPSYIWKINGLATGNSAATFESSAISDGDMVTCELTSSNVCATPQRATSNEIAMTITSQPSPTITLLYSTDTICEGTALTFTANALNAGTGAYQWQKNGVDVGTDSDTYIDNALNNSDKISCKVTSSLECALEKTATTTPATIAVKSKSDPELTIYASQTSICTGNTISITATPLNGGANPEFSWKINGKAHTETSNIMQLDNLVGGDIVNCKLTSNATCINTTSATSNDIAFTTDQISPSIQIATANTAICQGDNIEFSATVINGGDAPLYKWTKNGNPVGQNTPKYTDATLENGDEIACELTSNALCADTKPTSSNAITVTVHTPIIPTGTIATPETTLCIGAPATFTATVENSTETTFMWKKNGNDVGTNADTYTDKNLVDNDIVECVIVSSDQCATPITTNAIQISIGSSLENTVSIIASKSSICSGELVTFTATTNGGGLNPAFEWTKNGNHIGSDSNIYEDSELTKDDIIACSVTSSASCVAPQTAVSNSITIEVGEGTDPIVTIDIFKNIVCAGKDALFIAKGNYGRKASFEWTQNNNVVGTNNPILTLSDLTDGDQIKCTIQTVSSCATPTTVETNTIDVALTQPLIATIEIEASTSDICEGTEVSFTATTQNEGTEPIYKWAVNGEQIGQNSTTFTSNSLSNNDSISCTVVSNETCIVSNTVESNRIGMTVTESVTPAVSISTPTSTICIGSNIIFEASFSAEQTPSFSWTKNGMPVGSNDSIFLLDEPANNDIIACSITTASACGGISTERSNSISVEVLQKMKPQIFIVTDENALYDTSAITYTSIIPNQLPIDEYIWMKNGFETGVNSPQFTDQYPLSSDVVWCKIVSNSKCALHNSAVSNKITISISPIEIRADIADFVVAEGTATEIEFSAAPYSSQYQWQIDTTGLGFSDIESSLLYGGTKRNVLGINNVTADMNGYLYRCIITSGLFTDTSAVAMLIIGTPTAEEETIKSQCHIYPTFAEGSIIIEMADELIGETLQIVDAAGIIVETISENSKFISVNVVEYAVGKYFVVIKNHTPVLYFFKQ